MDSGGGISADALQHLFDPFFTTKDSGMGMGLPISQTIVLDHGGMIWAERGPGGGTIFYVTLPPLQDAVESAGVSEAVGQ
jgi:signal transduction histidine kinase